MAAQVAQAVFLDVDAIQQDLTLLMVVKARDQVGQGGLAAAGTPHQGDHLSGLGLETDALQHGPVGTGVLETEVAHFQASTDTLPLDGAAVDLGLFVQLLENAFRTGHAALHGGTDLGELADRLRQQAGGGDVGHQVARARVAAQEQHQEHQGRHGGVDHQLQHRGIDGRGLGHPQLLARAVLARRLEAPRLVGFAAETAHHTVALDGFGGDVGHVAHGHLDLLALLAEFLAGAAHHQGDQRQDGDHHQGQFPVHPQQVAEQEDHRQPFADHHLDRIGGGTGDHGHVEGDARDQVPGVVAVEVAVGQGQQAVEQGHAQVMHQAEGDLGQEIVAQVGTQPLPGGDQDDQQRHRLQQFQILQVGNAGEQDGVRVAQAIHEVLEDAGEHGLGRSEDDVADDADQEHPDIGTDIAQQAEIDLQAGGPGGFGVLIGHAFTRRRCRKVAKLITEQPAPSLEC
ncbi:hypothetical protein D9M71_119080 [compost metagenome]